MATAVRMASAEVIECDEPTSEEMAVMQLLARGLRDKEAAAHLYMSRSTFQRRLRSAMAKLGARTRVEAGLLLERSGWLGARPMDGLGARGIDDRGPYKA